MNVTITSIPKVTITTSRKEMFRSYLNCVSDMAEDIPSDGLGENVKSVHSALFNTNHDSVPQQIIKIKKLFRDGETYMLIPEAMERFEQNVHREIVIKDDNFPDVVVEHHDLDF